MKKKSVTIRQRAATGGKVSLYLDIYDGENRKTKSLGLFLSPEVDKVSKYHNKAIMEEAEIIRGKYLEELKEGKFAINEQRGSLMDFLNNLEKENPNWSVAKWRVWRAVTQHLSIHLKGKDIPLKKLDRKDIERFRDYLQFEAMTLVYGKGKRKIKAQTAIGLFVAFLGFVREAEELGLIKRVDLRSIKRIPCEEAQRQYLTVEEMAQLIKTPFKDSLRIFFLFSCFTGLRSGDLRRLKWEDIYEENGVYRVPYRQAKTKKMTYAYLPPDAIRLIGDPTGKKGYIFEQRKYSQEYTNRSLARWVKSAGIDKHITMHCGRHTYATTMISSGVDIYTVSKMLGHSSVRTTQVYAQIIDEKKVAACLAFPSFLPDKKAPQP